MLSLKALIVLTIITLSQSIRTFNDNCLTCQRIVADIDHLLLLNSTENVIVKEINYICGEDQYCEFVLPMIVNKMIDYVINQGDTFCKKVC
jgi:hypothetical protein